MVLGNGGRGGDEEGGEGRCNENHGGLSINTDRNRAVSGN